MSAACFCGCGRPVQGIRKRANNAVAATITEDLAVLQGARAQGATEGRGDEVAVLVSEGDGLLAGIRAYLHDEAGRGDLDKSATTSWLERARTERRALDDAGDGPPWKPDEPGTDVLVHTGQRTSGVISAVERSSLGNERVASLAVTVTIRESGERTTLTRTISIAVTEAPRVGDQVEVAYDGDARIFVYRPLVVLPDP
jgi:hypothetical protein